jgi:methyl-accepting chemotaxis protein
MNALAKQIGMRQFLYFIAVVGILGVPYVLFALEMTPGQMKQLLFIYAWEGVLFCGICTYLPMRWSRIVPAGDGPEGSGSAGIVGDPAQVLMKAFRLPQKAAVACFAIIVFAFAIGVLQLVLWARFNLIQSLQALTAGVIIAVVYAICTFLSVERRIGPYLGRLVSQANVTSPPRAFTIFSKVMAVCVGILFVAVLFEMSISYKHAIALLESRMCQTALEDLGRIKQSLNGFPVSQERLMAVLGHGEAAPRGSQKETSLFLLDRRGDLLFGKLTGTAGPEALPDLQALFEILKRHSVHKDILNGRIFCGVVLEDGEHLLGRSVDVAGMEKNEVAFLKQAVLASGLVLIVAIFLSYGLAFSVSEPLRKLNEVSERIGRGEFGLHPVIGGGDEVGALAFSFFRMEKALRKIILQVKQAALQINAASNQIVVAAEEQASGASEQASSVGETTANLEELSATARQISENSEAQAGMAESTLKNAEDSLNVMARTETVMSNIRQRTENSARKIMDLGEKSQKIGKVLGIINDIAAETKMLSLNAAIEASRAGEAGKGFSVVAAEIRKLAENVFKSTGSIEEMLREIQDAANASVMAAEENVKIVTAGGHELEQVKTALETIVHLAEETTQAAKEVSMTTGQQKTASEETALAMREISEVTRQMAAASTQTTTSVQDLHRLAQELQELTSVFKVASEPESPPNRPTA